MTFKKMFAVLAAAGVFCAFAAPNDAEIYKNTMKYVDKRGETLLFYNSTRIISEIGKLPSLISRVVDIAGVPAGTSAEINKKISLVMELINLQSIKAFAVSTRDVKFRNSDADYFMMKKFTYLGADAMSQPGLTTICSDKNSALNWRTLPFNTVFAFSANINLGSYLKFALEKVSRDNKQVLTQVEQVFAILQAQGIERNALFAALNGVYSLQITGYDSKTLGIKITVPDSNGALAGALNRLFPQETAKGNRIALPLAPAEFPNIKPEIVIGRGKITLVSDKQLMIPASTTLGFDSNFLRYGAVVPKHGTGYCLFNISDMVLSSLKKDRKFAEAGKLLKNLKPMSMLSVGYAEDCGYGSVMISNFAVDELVQELLFLMQTNK